MPHTLTPARLIERLKNVYGASSDEALARELQVPTRRIAGYKNGDGMQFARTIELLDRAGWLNIDEDAPGRVETPGDPLGALAAGVAALEAGQEQILKLLRSQQAEKQSPSQGGPRAKRQSS